MVIDPNANVGTGWQDVWDRIAAARDANPALAAHYQAELDVMAPTMQALGLGSGSSGPGSGNGVGDASYLSGLDDPSFTGGLDDPDYSGDPNDPAYLAGLYGLDDLPDTDDSDFPGPLSLSSSAAGSNTLGSGFPKHLEPYRAFILKAAAATGVDPNILAAMMWDESHGDKNARSTNPGNGGLDAGLLQVNSQTFATLKAKYPKLLSGDDVFDPATNVMAGALYFKEQLDAFGDVKQALRAYNSGPGAVNPNNLSDAGSGTSNYVDKVAAHYKTITGRDL